MTFSKSTTCIAITACLFNLAASAEVQLIIVTNNTKTLETITVTSNFRQQRLQKTPTPLSVLPEL